MINIMYAYAPQVGCDDEKDDFRSATPEDGNIYIE